MAEATRQMRLADEGGGGKAIPRRVTLTKSLVEGLTVPTGRADVHVYDVKVAGLAYRLTAGGARSWYLVRRIGGRPHRVRLGGRELTVEQARTAAAKMNGEIAGGANPAVERQTVRRGGTLGELWKAYRDKHLKPRASAKTILTDESRWATCFAGWESRKVLAVTEADVRTLHAALGAERGHVTANRAAQLLRRVYNWARLGQNPAAGGTVTMFRETSRDRFVQPDELPKLFKALEAEETNPLIRDFLIVCLLTGARRSNVAAMRTDELNLAAATWTIPAAKSKNGRAMTVPLSPPALKLVADRAAAVAKAGAGEPADAARYIFPGPGKTGHLVEPKATWRAVLKRAGLTDLRLHDLRRTLGSWQAAGGASLSVIGASLGHQDHTTTAIYARLNLDPVRASVVNATDAMLAAARGEGTPPATPDAKGGKAKRGEGTAPKNPHKTAQKKA